MKDFEQFVDTKILPSIREQLLNAYSKGYQESSKDNYIKVHGLEGHIADFGLPSGTIWVTRMEGLCFSEAKALGLQFPTEEQVKELQKCKWRFEQHDGWHGHIKGPNGNDAGAYSSESYILCLWTNESTIDENFMVKGYVVDYSGCKESRYVFVGDKFSTLFVLPKDLV